MNGKFKLNIFFFFDFFNKKKERQEKKKNVIIVVVPVNSLKSGSTEIIKTDWKLKHLHMASEVLIRNRSIWPDWWDVSGLLR